MDLSSCTIKELEARLLEEEHPDTKYEIIYILVQKYGRTDVDKAIRYLEDYMHYALEMGNMANQFRAHSAYGILYNFRGETTRSFESYQKALLVAESLNHLRWQANALNGLGTTLLSMEMTEKALQKYRKALDISIQEGDPSATYTTNVGVSLLGLGQPEDALPYLLQGLELEREQPNTRLRSDLLMNLGAAYFRLNNNELAKEYLLQGIGAGKSCDNYINVGHSLIYLAEIVSVQKAYEEARSYLEEALLIYEKLNAPAGKAETYKALTTLFETEGCYKEALEHHRLYHEFRSRLISESALQKANNLETQLELERKEKQLELERAEHKEELARQKLETITNVARDVAHSVQNPLQFVNNFSELNLDLIQEQIECYASGDGKGFLEANEHLSANCRKVREYGKQIATIIDQLQLSTRRSAMANPENHEKE